MQLYISFGGQTLHLLKAEHKFNLDFSFYVDGKVVWLNCEKCLCTDIFLPVVWPDMCVGFFACGIEEFMLL